MTCIGVVEDACLLQFELVVLEVLYADVPFFRKYFVWVEYALWDGRTTFSGQHAITVKKVFSKKLGCQKALVEVINRPI